MVKASETVGGQHGSDALSTVVAVLARPEVGSPQLMMDLSDPKVGGV